MRKKLWILGFLLFSLFVFFLLKVNSFAQPHKDYASDRILVKFKDTAGKNTRESFLKKWRITSKKRFDDLNLDVVLVPKEKVDEYLTKVEKEEGVEYAEPDYKVLALEETNDPYLENQWGLYKIQAAGKEDSAWNYSKGDPLIKIAILDTGIDQDHGDLSNKVAQTKNCTDSPTADDLYGHGTHVAGIAAALTNNDIGVAGVGYKASLINAKVLGDDGSGYYSWIIDCLKWSADNGAKVINMSLGAPYKSKALEQAVNDAWRKGVVLVAAAGNSGSSSPTYPAYYSNVIAVAATDSNDKKPSWSSFGRWVDVAAPGVDIYSTFPNHENTLGGSGYGYASGTSMATPHVAGVAALVWATSSFGQNNLTVRQQIEKTADKIAGTGKYWTYGRVNALKAVTTSVSSTSR